MLRVRVRFSADTQFNDNLSICIFFGGCSRTKTDFYKYINGGARRRTLALLCWGSSRGFFGLATPLLFRLCVVRPPPSSPVPRSHKCLTPYNTRVCSELHPCCVCRQKVDRSVGMLPSLRHGGGEQSGGLAGLKNWGRTCYLNAVLQQAIFILFWFCSIFFWISYFSFLGIIVACTSQRADDRSAAGLELQPPPPRPPPQFIMG